MSTKIKNILLPLIFGVLFLVLWENGGVHQLLNLKPYQLPVPSKIAGTLMRIYPTALVDAWITIKAALFGMTIGSFIGFMVAVLATVFSKWGYGGLTVISAFNAIPIVALSPIMNRWFSNSAFFAKVGVVTIVCMAAMSINSYRGLNDLKPFSLDLMKSYAAKKRVIFLKLRLPNCIPNVFVALKINVASAMIAAIVSEYFAQDASGLGFGIKNFLRRAEMASGWSYITVAAVIGILLYAILSLVERHAVKWHASQR
jgi:ABC-type nitrate/sulfonate/bicarbonate transport system, permease component